MRVNGTNFKVNMCNNSFIFMSNLSTQKGIKGSVYTQGISFWWLPNGSQALVNKYIFIQNHDKIKKIGPIPTGIYTYVPDSTTILLVGIYENTNKGMSIVQITLPYFALVSFTCECTS